ncbi:MAG: alkaline phosphatase family protein [Acidobacteriota bacterium]
MNRTTLAIATLTLLLALPMEAAKRRAVRSQGEKPILHVVVVVLENTNAAVAETRPFLSRLIREGAWLTNFQSVGHPSQPNYLAMATGSTWGKDNTIVTLDVRHLGDLLEEAGRSWQVYAENYPGNCFLQEATPDFLYVRRHMAFLSMANIQRNPERCREHIVNAAAFDADIAFGNLPAYALYIPNQDHNGHDTGIDFADFWLETRFGPLLRDPRFTSHTLFVVTFDESVGADLRVTTILWGAGVTMGAQSSRRYDHYSLLRTIEELLHTGSLHLADESAVPIRDVLITQ